MSTNVFADISLSDPETHLAEAKIIHALSRSLCAQGLTQAEAGARLGLSQTNVSALLNGQFRGYSVERLLGFVNALDQNAGMGARAE